jgi:hypothetical protein
MSTILRPSVSRSSSGRPRRNSTKTIVMFEAIGTKMEEIVLA